MFEYSISYAIFFLQNLFRKTNDTLDNKTTFAKWDKGFAALTQLPRVNGDIFWVIFELHGEFVFYFRLQSFIYFICCLCGLISEDIIDECAHQRLQADQDRYGCAHMALLQLR